MIVFLLVISLISLIGNQSLAAMHENELPNWETPNPTFKNTEESTTIPKHTLTNSALVNVSTFAEFRDALRNELVDEINIIKDITDAPSGTEIVVPGHNVTIYGNNKTINLNTSWIRLQNITNSTPYYFKLFDANLINTVAAAFVNTYYNDPKSEYWSLSFSNITTNTNMQRLARASRSNITFGGTNKINMRAENVYAGGVTFLPNTNYEGVISFYDYSIIWFQDGASSTGRTSHQFNIGEGATVNLKGTSNGATYPAIFQYYDSINIAPGGSLNVEKHGVTVAFHQDNSSLNVERGATFRATSLSSSTNIVGIDARRPFAKNISINAQEGSNFLVEGNSTSPLISLSTPGSKLVLTKPAKFDICNSNNLASSNGYAVQVGLGASFEIIKSDLNVWTKGLDLEKASAFSWYNASLLSDVNGLPISASEPSILAYFKGKTFSRISATNSLIVITLNEVTNADKKLTGKVFVDGLKALQGQVELTVSNNQDNQTWIDRTDQNGNFNINLEKYYNEQSIFTVTGSRWSNPTKVIQTITVNDRTPPTPAFVNEPVSIVSKYIFGTSDEPGAIVTVTVNGKEINLRESIVVGTDGKWEIPLHSALHDGDVVQIFLTDQNNNKNPETDTIFHDAYFYKATKTIVSKETSFNPILTFNTIPSSVNFKTTTISSLQTFIQRDEENWKMSVLDSRGIGCNWMITASIDEPLTSTSNPSHKMLNALVYVNKDGDSIPLNQNELKVFEHTTGADPITDINWTSNQGILVKTSFVDVYSESYKTTINWTLTNAP
ncbi:pectate lyase-like adhesive domain-containing protein [Bacillus sp. EAC]|uniref:pectate lyase-like adhesive domain-containing protein n=1 Tax=Bacillus sp. EAC TaxID=1978338 RepID=UPI001C4F5DB6|nr:pectate lyase-like adhesive domain-containing protein [Bacillus sp. EAC]